MKTPVRPTPALQQHGINISPQEPEKHLLIIQLLLRNVACKLECFLNPVTYPSGKDAIEKVWKVEVKLGRRLDEPCVHHHWICCCQFNQVAVLLATCDHPVATFAKFLTKPLPKKISENMMSTEKTLHSCSLFFFEGENATCFWTAATAGSKPVTLAAASLAPVSCFSFFVFLLHLYRRLATIGFWCHHN